MTFDLDRDLSEEFSGLVSDRKKKGKGVKNPADFDFSMENAGSLDLGTGDFSEKDPIAVGHDRLFSKADGRKKKPIRPIKKGGDFISGEF